MKTKDSFLWITLKKSFLDKTSAAANKRAIEEFRGEPKEEAKDTLYYNSADLNLNDEAQVEYKPDEDTLEVRVDSDLGYFSYSIPLGLDIKISIIEGVTKQFNKVKSMLESAK